MGKSGNILLLLSSDRYIFIAHLAMVEPNLTIISRNFVSHYNTTKTFNSLYSGVIAKHNSPRYL